jgi:hypothetical protein
LGYYGHWGFVFLEQREIGSIHSLNSKLLSAPTRFGGLTVKNAALIL